MSKVPELVPVSDLRQDVAAVLKRLQASREPLVITQRGRAAADAAKPELGIVVGRASGVKCGRCWRYVSAVSTNPAQSGICERCQDALAETVTS